ncbi:GGDEF domain-containing protein [Sulfurimonas sp. HSL-1716]|uniref:GGDEF domain-containing protein n=1 Tax=Hydrocurvibacter sulfurireducens TaxID=3131937 RepID=UPI0031F9501E
MKNLNKEKKRRTLYFFIFITLVPVLGILIISSYAFLHVQDDVDFVSYEIRGLKVISRIEKTVFDIQALRDLSCIKDPNEKSIETLKENISKDLTSLENILLILQKDISLKSELLQYVKKTKNTPLTDKGDEYFTHMINDFMLFSNNIAFRYKLILDPYLSSYVLMDNVVYLLPELMEYNRQIKAITLGMHCKTLTPEQKEQLSTLQIKIKDRLNKLDYNKLFMQKKEDIALLERVRKNIMQTQNKVAALVSATLSKEDKTALETDNIFTLMTNDLDSIRTLYDSNLQLLHSNLEKKLKKNRKLSVIILCVGLLSILFIIYINRVFYNKNREYIDIIEELTITDALTSLYNRRHFDDIFNNFLKIQLRAKQTPVFIILDIDYFKQYNDTYGHQAGDMAIKTVARHLKRSLKRAGDMAFRLGGEEFGILYTEENRSKAFSFADTIRKKIESEKIEHSKNNASRYLTVSMGIIIIEEEFADNIRNIYRCADEALYKAKADGRNRAVIYNTLSSPAV